MSLLQIDNLGIRSSAGTVLVDQLSLQVDTGEWVALVGESGSGKSLTALSCLQLLPAGLSQQGQVRWQGKDIAQFTPNQLQKLRGGDVGMVYQEPLTALNPLHRIGRQLLEAITLHQPLQPAMARQKAINLLKEVGIDEPERRLLAWPHELSGGQRQRVVIAMALANSPKLLIADEPTTALDALLQNQILDLLKSLQRRRGLAVLHISHDLPQVRRYADRILVMQAGCVLEAGNTETVFAQPQHDYTRLLLQPFADAGPCPRSGENSPRNETAAPRLSVSQLHVRYPLRKHWWGGVAQWHEAVRAVGLTLAQGEALGVVGESGSGKSSLAAALLRLVPAQGRVVLLGQDWLGLSGEPLRKARAQLQLVFQDPYGSLSPRLSVGELIAEGLRAHQPLSTEALDSAVCAALKAVKLDPACRHRYPHEFSGGQRQRIALARALILKPAVLVLDEPTSALDRHTQGEIVALLRELQRERGISYLFISHDLRVIRALCHRVLVMQQGQIVETGDSERLFNAPRHPYTKALLAAMALSLSPQASPT
ncbi:MAG: dipeptide ABC transporter ATP-binding protein [Pseudomonadota bacterium]